VYQSFYLANDYFTGGSPLRYAFVGGLSVGTAFIVAPLANYLSKRFTFRFPMLIGKLEGHARVEQIMMATSCRDCLLHAWTSSGWHIAELQRTPSFPGRRLWAWPWHGQIPDDGHYTSMRLTSFLIQTLVPCQPLLAHWFDKRLALAQGLSNAGSGVGGLIFSNTTRLAIETVGLKYSLVINGLISLVVLTPAVLLMRGKK
jgi:hypothetical protein